MKGILTPLLALPAGTDCLGKEEGLRAAGKRADQPGGAAESSVRPVRREKHGAESEPGLGGSRRVERGLPAAPPEQEEPGVSGRRGTTVLPLV